MKDLSYDNIISTVNELFPDFGGNDELNLLTENLPGVHLTLLISHLKYHWSDRTLQNKLASFSDQLCRLKDKSSQVTFDDFALDFQLAFKEHQIDIVPFLELLSPDTRREFQKVLDFWLVANERANKAGG